MVFTSDDVKTVLDAGSRDKGNNGKFFCLTAEFKPAVD